MKNSDRILDQLFAQLQTQSPEEAKKIELKIWREWRKSGSRAIDFLLKRAMRAMEHHQWPLAIEHLSAAIDHAPDFAEAWNMRATAYYAKGELGLSMFDIHETLRLNPRHFGALSGMALILEKTGRSDEAIWVYQRVLDLHPTLENAQNAIKRLMIKKDGTPL